MSKLVEVVAIAGRGRLGVVMRLASSAVIRIIRALRLGRAEFGLRELGRGEQAIKRICCCCCC